MELLFTNNKYTIYYDESNNMRKLLLAGDEYNIDNDPNQDASPIFVLAGIAFANSSKQIDFDLLKKKMHLQKECTELKFSQMVKIRAKYTPIEAFRYALGSKRFKTLFECLSSREVFIHYKMINTVYWSFLDIIEDIVLCINAQEDWMNQLFYKNCLYRLIKLDKENFLSLMTDFNYPNITKENSLKFLERLNDLIMKNVAVKFSEGRNDQDSEMLVKLGFLVYKCIKLFGEKLNFELVFDHDKDILIEDFSTFYINRLKTFPNSEHILDKECKIEEKINNVRMHDPELDAVNFTFVESKEAQNYLVQISDVTAGFIRLYFNFLEYSSIEEVSLFIDSLNPTQKQTMSLFKELLDKSVEECHILLHRVVVPMDEHKASILLD